MDLHQLIKKANEEGFETVAPLDIKTLQFLPEIRDMCKADRCHKYGHCWTCPPACGSLGDCEAAALKYNSGIIVQTVGEVEDEFDYDGFMRVEAIHKERFFALTEKLRDNGYDILPLGSGACTICGECTYPEKPCRFPQKAIISMEAFGLWVSDVCKQNGVPYNYGQNKIAYTSCILIR